MHIKLFEKSIILVFVFFSLCQYSSAEQGKITSRTLVYYNSFGPIKIGMTVAEAKKILDIPLVKEDQGSGEACYYLIPQKRTLGFAFMVTNGRIARFDIDSKEFATEAGARVGNSESRIKSLYRGRVKVTGHTYVPQGHYLTVTLHGTAFQVVFETDGKRVTGYRLGKTPEAWWIEGCS